MRVCLSVCVCVCVSGSTMTCHCACITHQFKHSHTHTHTHSIARSLARFSLTHTHTHMKCNCDRARAKKCILHLLHATYFTSSLSSIFHHSNLFNYHHDCDNICTQASGMIIAICSFAYVLLLKPIFSATFKPTQSSGFCYLLAPSLCILS